MKEARDLTPDYRTARRFFDVIRPVERCTFQTFDEGPAKRRQLVRVFAGAGNSIDLAMLNALGAGVYVSVNPMRRGGRSMDHVLKIDTIFADFDEGAPATIPIEPTLKVQTSICPDTGVIKEQWWWRLLGCLTLAEQRGIMARLVAEYGADRNAKDAARCGRLPGFWHRKREPQLVRIIGGTGAGVRCDDMIEAFPKPPEPERPRVPSRDIARTDDRYLDGALRSLCDELGRATEGRRNPTLNWCAYRLADLGLPGSDIARHLVPIAEAIGLPRSEIERTIASAIAGADRARGAAA